MNFAVALLLGIFIRIWWVTSFLIAISFLILSIIFAIASVVIGFPSRVISWIGACFYTIGTGLGNMTNAQIQQKIKENSAKK